MHYNYAFIRDSKPENKTTTTTTTTTKIMQKCEACGIKMVEIRQLIQPLKIIWLGLDDMSLAWPVVVQLLIFIYSGIQKN